MCAYVVYFLVVGGKRVLQEWAEAHAPEDSVAGAVLASEGLFWPGEGGVLVCSGLRRLVCGWCGLPRSRARPPWLARTA